MSRARVLDLVGLAARLILGVTLAYAGYLKIGSLQASARSVQAYQLLPFDVATYVGYALPIVEIILGVLLILGLFTRTAAVLGAALMLAFIIGIASAWARGLSIDCGCFGDGGIISLEKAQRKYPIDIARDIGLALCGLWLVWRPASLASLDRALFGDRNVDSPGTPSSGDSSQTTPTSSSTQE